MTKLLSDEQKLAIAQKVQEGLSPQEDTLAYANAIEAAVLEAQAGQEPVAWMYVNQFGIVTGYSPVGHGENWKPLYAAPVVQPDMVQISAAEYDALLEYKYRYESCAK